MVNIPSKNCLYNKAGSISNQIHHIIALKRYPHFLLTEVRNVQKQNKIPGKFKLILWVIISHSRAYIEIALITVIKSCLRVLKILAERISRSALRGDFWCLCAKILDTWHKLSIATWFMMRKNSPKCIFDDCNLLERWLKDNFLDTNRLSNN